MTVFKRMFFRLLPATLLLTCILAVHAENLKPVPPLQGHVTDLVGMLTPEQRHSLENTLQQYEQEKGSQIAILLVSSTEPESIEQYSIRVVDSWKLGRKGIDDGVLLLVAKNNPPSLNRLRIEVGRGAEGVLTDIQSKHILQDIIAPYFRQNNFYGGLDAGILAIITALNQEAFPVPESKTETAGRLSSLLSLLIIIVFFILIARAKHRGNFLAGVILGGTLINHNRHDDSNDSDRGGFGGGGFSGGGGGFSGGGASGNW